MPPARDILVEASLNLAWSHWVGLGVRGTAQPPSTAVDPEALLYFTACLMDHDPRLRDEVGDWWARFHRHISRPRLTALAAKFDESTVMKFKDLERFFVALKNTSGKSRLDRLDIPARSLLRFRCAFGANARAEILLELLTQGFQPGEGATAFALSEVGYSKRNVAFVLEDLALAGILTFTKEGNRVRFRIAESAALESALRPLPRASGRWHLRLPIIASFVELSSRLRGRDAVVQGVEARKLLKRMTPRLSAIAATSMMPTVFAETYWDILQQWLIDNVVIEDADDTHRIPRMLEGAWFGPGQDIRRPDRFVSALLPQISSDPVKDAELLCLDLVQVPTIEPPNDWAWSVLSTVATSTYSHTIGLDNGERWRFATWALGEPRVYSVTYEDHIRHDRIAQRYGQLAGARARNDRPAVQLRLIPIKADA